MIYVTGDIHVDYDIRKLTAHNWREGTSLCAGDYLVVCGDFGLVWDDSPTDYYWRSWLNEKPWTTLWVDGNHENHDLIDTFETEEFFGGLVQRVPGYDKLIHLMRGEVYELPIASAAAIAPVSVTAQTAAASATATSHVTSVSVTASTTDVSSEQTVRVFVMGGAASSDRAYRHEGKTWWAREMPTQEEYDHATANLERVGFSVDYVFTHDCPANYVDFAVLGAKGERRHLGGEEDFDMLENFLQWVDDRLDKTRLKRWYFGHYHSDLVCRDEQHVLLYQQIVELGALPE